MDIVKDICTIDELSRNPKQVVRKLHDVRRPMLLTIDGHPEVILLSAKLFPTKQLALDAACELAGLEPV